MSDAAPIRLRFEAFELDEGNARLTREGKAVALPPKALAVLCALARSHGQLVTKGALLDAVWGHQHVSESVLKTIISEVRAALADDAKQPRFIETVSRFGYRFIGNAGASAAPLPPIPLPTPALNAVSSLIGRTEALATLRTSWRQAQSGIRQLVWIAGEAGVGKSTLIDSFRTELGPDSTASGHCVEHFGTGEPYLPLLEALRELCSRDPALPTLMRTVAPTWIIQMPWLINEAERSALHRELSGTHPDRMVREFHELMDRYTAQRPLTLVLEDLHWSDVGTLRMLEQFARQPRPLRLLCIASFRLTQVIAEDHPLRGLRQELKLHRSCEEILLDPFSEAEVGAYLATRLPKVPIEEAFVRRLHEHTDGLPLFVVNVADTLLAQAATSPVAEHAWRPSASGPLPVPDSLTGVIDKQIRQLPEELQSLLEAASVCGLEFRAGIVAGILDKEVAWVREHCDGLVRRKIWLQSTGITELPDGEFDTRYAFLHALYSHVFYQHLPLSLKVQFHRQVAKAIERGRATAQDFVASELASHYERGHEPVPAMRAYYEAAQSALGRYAPKEAAALASQGLALLPRCADPTERRELEFDLIRPFGVAASLNHGVASSEALRAFERIRELYVQLPQTPARAVALNGMGWVLYVRGQYAEAMVMARELEEVAQRHDDPVLMLFACNLAGVALIAQGENVAGSLYLERGIALCQSLGDRAPLTAFVIDPEVSMRMNVAFPLFDRGLWEEARTHIRAGLGRAERIGQPISLMLAYWCSGMVDIRAGNAVAVAQHAAALAQVVERAVLPQGQGPSLWLRGWAEAQLGEPRIGYDHILEGYASHARLGMYSGCPEVLGYATEALILAEDWAGAQKQLDAALDLTRRINENLALPYLLLLQARIASAREDLERARMALHESVLEARKQKAASIELRSLVALAEIEDDKQRDLTELKSAYRKMKEGSGLAFYRRAGELLAARA